MHETVAKTTIRVFMGKLKLVPQVHNTRNNIKFQTGTEGIMGVFIWSDADGSYRW